MAAIITVATNLPSVIERLDVMAATAVTETRAMLTRSAVAVRQIGVMEIASHTPMDATHSGQHLGQTTEAEIATSGSTASITYRQTKLVPWKDHGDYPLARFLIDGTSEHTIEAPPGHYLFWEGAEHPVKRVQHPGTAPNDYPGRALEQMQPAIGATLALEADAVARTVVRSLAA